MAPQFVAVVQTASPVGSWAPVVLLLIIGFGFAFANIALSLFVGPRRTGPGKETTYESGMLPIGDARRRFNVRFYIVAMIFLVFDVEVIFFYPWATIFAKHVQADTSDNGDDAPLQQPTAGDDGFGSETEVPND